MARADRSLCSNLRGSVVEYYIYTHHRNTIISHFCPLTFLKGNCCNFGHNKIKPMSSNEMILILLLNSLVTHIKVSNCKVLNSCTSCRPAGGQSNSRDWWDIWNPEDGGCAKYHSYPNHWFQTANVYSFSNVNIFVIKSYGW